jgi:antitoxin protein of toxin-antitoxin system
VPSQDPEGTVGSVNLLGKARSLLTKNKDAAKTGVDKAGDTVDKKTDGTYSGQVDTAQDKAKDFIDKPDNPS